METVINQDAAKMLAACLNDPEGKSSEEGRKEYVRITWTDRKDPPMNNCFWAFSQEQFLQGLSRFGLLEDWKAGKIQIEQARNGLIGTHAGIEAYFRALAEMTAASREEIREKCTPQDVYEVEYNNYECMYDWDGDLRALDRVVFWFGKDAIYKVRRKGYAGMSIEAALERLEKGE